MAGGGDAAAPSQVRLDGRGTDGRPDTPPGGHPLHARRDVLILVVPTILYLLVFSVFPLAYSLGISFFDWSQTTRSFTFIGLGNYQRLIADPVFLQSAGNTAIMVGLGVTIQVILGTALALFFDLHLRGMWFVRGVLILPMLLTPIVVGLMWRALLNPEWGMINWILGELGLPQPLWLADPAIAIFTLIFVDSWQWTPFIFVIVFARLQALPRDVFEASAVDGATRRQRMLARDPAAAGARHRVRHDLPCHRRVPRVRRRVRPHLWRPGQLHVHDQLLHLGDRLQLHALWLLVRAGLRDGHRGHDHGHGAAALRARAPGGRDCDRPPTGAGAVRTWCCWQSRSSGSRPS